MTLTKKHFEGLAKVVRGLLICDYDHDYAGERVDQPLVRKTQVIDALADFCQAQAFHGNFDRDRFVAACLKEGK